MRKLLLCAVAIVAVGMLSATARAADEPTAEKGGKKSEERRSELFDKLDANHDGQITADEVPEEQRRLFNRLLRQGDGNHDGKLSRAEFLGAKDDAPPANADAKSAENSPNDRRPEAAAGERPAGGGMGGFGGGMGNGQFMMGIALLHAIDTNGDGVLDASEIAAATASLKKLDTNSDGEISREEMRAAVPPAMMENLRAGMGGGGGAGGNPEAAMARLMTQFDTNKDGKLEKSELPTRLQEQFDELDTNHDGSLDETETRAILPRLLRRMENGNGPGAGKGNPARQRPDAEKKADEK